MEEYQIVAVKKHIQDLFNAVSWHCDQIKIIQGKLKEQYEFLERGM